MPFSDGNSTLGLAAGGRTRLLIPSVRELSVGRSFEGYTVTRIIFNLKMISDVSALNVVKCGILTQNEDVLIGSVDAGDTLSDWLWHEEFIVGQDDSAPERLISRDIRSQRKARGGQSELYFMLENLGGGALQVHRSGRCLVKRA